MSKSLIFMFLLFIIILGGGLLYYFFYQVDVNNQDIKYFNVNILTSDITGYKLYVNNVLYKEGKTSDKAATLVKVPINKTIKLVNYNLDGQNYYSNEYKLNTYNKSENQQTRINVDLIEPGKLKIGQTDLLRLGNKVMINVTSEGYIKQLRFCLKWSARIIYAKAIGDFNKVEPFLKQDKCYETNKDLNDMTLEIPIEYTNFGDLQNGDTIKVTFLDKQYDNETKNIKAVYNIL